MESAIMLVLFIIGALFYYAGIYVVAYPLIIISIIGALIDTISDIIDELLHGDSPY